MYLGGNFVTVGGSTRNGAACVDAQTGVATSWNPNVNNGFSNVFALAVVPGKVAIGGRIRTINGTTPRDNIAVVDDTIGAATSFAPVVGGDVRTVQISGTTVFAGGLVPERRGCPPPLAGGDRPRHRTCSELGAAGRRGAEQPGHGARRVRLDPLCRRQLHHSAGGAAPRNRLAAYDTGTGALLPWNPNLNGNVLALAVDGSSIYAGGTFTTVGGGTTTRNRLAAFDATTAAPTDWNPNANNAVRALAVDGSTVYAAGSFTTVNGSATRNRAAAFDVDTGALTAWDPDLNNTVNTVAVALSSIYLGGSFTTANGGTVSRNHLAAFDTLGRATDWNPDASGTVNVLRARDIWMLVGGSFTTLAGGTVARQNLAELDTWDSEATAWDPTPDRAVNAIDLSAFSPVVGGQFTGFGHVDRTPQTAVAVFAPLDRTITAAGTAARAIQNRVFDGDVATFTVPSASADASEFAATIVWSDRASGAGTIVGGDGSFTVSGEFVFSTPGHFPLTVTITDRTDAANHDVADTTVDVSEAQRRVAPSLRPVTTDRPPEPPAPPSPSPRPGIPPH